MTIKISPSLISPFNRITGIHFPGGPPTPVPVTVYVIIGGGYTLGTTTFNGHVQPYGAPNAQYGVGGLLPPPLTPLIISHDVGLGDFQAYGSFTLNTNTGFSPIMTWKLNVTSIPITLSFAGGYYASEAVAQDIASDPFNGGALTVVPFVL